MTDMKQIASSFASIREVPGYLSQQGTQESEEVQKMQQEQGKVHNGMKHFEDLEDFFDVHNLNKRREITNLFDYYHNSL